MQLEETLEDIMYSHITNELLRSGLSTQSSSRRAPLHVFWDPGEGPSVDLDAKICVSSIPLTNGSTLDPIDTFFLWADSFPIQGEENQDILSADLYHDGVCNSEVLFGDIVMGGNEQLMVRDRNSGTFKAIRNMYCSDETFSSIDSALSFTVDFLNNGVYQNLRDLYDGGLAEPVQLKYSGVASMKRNGSVATPDLQFKWENHQTPYSITIRGEVWEVLIKLNNGKIPNIFVPEGPVDVVFCVAHLDNTEQQAIAYWEPTLELNDLQYWLDLDKLVDGLLYKDVEGFLIPFADPPVSSSEYELSCGSICGLSYSQAYKVLRQRGIDYEAIFWDDHIKRIGEYIEDLPNIWAEIANACSSQIDQCRKLHLCRCMRKEIEAYSTLYTNFYNYQEITEQITALERHIRESADEIYN